MQMLNKWYTCQFTLTYCHMRCEMPHKGVMHTFYEFTVATLNPGSLKCTFSPPVTFNSKIQMTESRWMLFIDLIYKMSLCLLFPLLCCFVGSFAVIDCLIMFSTLNVQLWDLLFEAEEAFLSFLSFKCQLASEWPRGLPSSTLHNLLSVCKVLRGPCHNLTRPQSGGGFSVFHQTTFCF